MIAKPIEDIYPLSPLQKSFLFHSQLDPASTAYLVQLLWALEGPLDTAALRRSWEEIFRRHSILRTDFAWRSLEEPVQIVYRETALDFELQQARGEGEEEMERLLRSDREIPFDLGRAPLARLRLVHVREGLHYLLLSFHHILLDGWSLGIVLKELCALYTSCQSQEVPALGSIRPYRDYVAWHLSQRKGCSSESYWRRTLNGFREPNRLSFPGGGEGHREIHATASLEISRELQAVARRNRLTLASLLQGLWALVVSRESGDEDVVFGATVSGRPPELEGVESMVGLFINTVPVRLRVRRESPFVDWLSECSRIAVDSPDHENVPPVEIQGYSDVPRGLPLYESLIVFQNYPHDRGLTELGPGLTITGMKHWSATEIPLHLRVRPAEPLGLDLVHDRSKVDDERADSILAYILEALGAIAKDPKRPCSDLLFTGQESSRGVSMAPLRPRVDFARFESEEAQSIPSRFRKAALDHRDRVAVETDSRSLRYEDLDRASSAVASKVAERLPGAPGNARVGLLFEHDAPMVVALLGASKAGKAYVPLDPRYPRRRLEDMMSDSGPGLLLTNGRNRELAETLTSGTIPVLDTDSVDVGAGGSGPEATILPDALAYLLYTSGSTGRPKGVMQSHGNALHHVRAYTNSLGIDSRDRLTLLSSFGFDAAVLDVLGALLNGATLCPFDVRERGIAALGRFLEEREISIYHSTPTVFRAFAETLRPGARFRNVRLVVLGGEEVKMADQELFAAHFREDAVFVNLYGATEATLAHLHTFPQGPHGRRGETPVPLGKPVEGIETWLLDREGRRAAKFGEIGIRSRFVALGYWSRPEETAARFLPDPDDPDEGDHRIYRTGDMGRLRGNGTLEFVGRKDFLVKLRGQRVETGEVEAALAESGLVSRSVVLAREIECETVLVAYVVLRSPASTAKELRRALSDRLPDYMVPARFVFLSSIPLTPTGKVDRRALPEPGAAEESNAGLETPRTPAEELVKEVWGQVLRLDRIALRENFFDVGGHSLKLTQVASRLEDALGAEVSLRELFDHPTIESLAKRLETRFPSLSRDQKPVTGPREANHLNT